MPIKYILIVLTAVAGIVGTFTKIKKKDSEVFGLNALTTTGKFMLAVLFVSVLGTLYSLYNLKEKI
jgi:hypothetical protein